MTNGPKRLIVYVGPSSAGSISLAARLRRGHVALKSIGAQYWGATLEIAPSVSYDWQHHRPPEGLLEATLGDDGFPWQFVDAVHQGFNAGAVAGIRHAIIVNDSWMDGRWCDRTIEVLGAVAETLPVEIVVVAYVHSPSAYAQSAYAQSALEHKVQSSHIRPWRERAPRYTMHFAEHMEAFDRAFGERFLLRNYEAMDDIVEDFLGAVGLGDVSLPALDLDVRPSTEEELIRAFYNTRQHRPALPEEFRRFADVDFNHDVIGWFQGLLPTRGDVRAAAAELKDDLRRMNALLAARGQPPVRDRRVVTRGSEIDLGRLISALLQIVYNQHARIEALEERSKRDA